MILDEIDPSLLDLAKQADAECKPIYDEIDNICFYHSNRILSAFIENNVSYSDFAEQNGYGDYDEGRNKLEKIFAAVLGCEDSLVRPQIMSGTNALYLTFSSLLKPGDTMISLTGTPYDSLQEMIGLSGDSTQSLKANGVKYEQIDLLTLENGDNDFDEATIVNRLERKDVKLVEIQRSRGYSARASLTIDKIEKIIADTFLQMAEGLETGNFGKKPRIALTGMGSEHGEENAMEAAKMAAKDGIDVYYIGTLEADGITTVKVTDDEEGHKKMEEMLASHEVDGAVTMHFPFPIGVSTVGRVVTPAKGREMFIANTTGTSSSDRIEGMIKNTIYGIIAAKACGKEHPTVGILNVDGARQTEMALKELEKNGYDITFAESARADGGCVMRGNDVLQGTPDIMVCDSLTGNIMVKMLSSYTTGGSFEASGYGYGPGVGEGYEQLVMIVSRASGAPVIAGAIRYAAELVKSKVFEIAKKEFVAADKAGLKDILAARKQMSKPASEAIEVKAPPKEIVTSQIAGIEVMDLEDAVKVLWKQNIYAESGMGCTGPIIRVSDANLAKAEEELKKAGYIN